MRRAIELRTIANGGSIPGTHMSAANTNKIANSDSKVAITIGHYADSLKIRELEFVADGKCDKPERDLRNDIKLRQKVGRDDSSERTAGNERRNRRAKQKSCNKIAGNIRQPEQLANRPNAIPAKIITDRMRSVCICIKTKPSLK